MGIPTYEFPKSLLHVWWKPMVLAGFEVDLDFDQDESGVRQFLENQKGAEEFHVPFGGRIRFEDSSVRVSIFRKSEISSDELGCMLWSYPSRKAYLIDMVSTVERILLSSGCRAEQKPFSCRVMYSLNVRPPLKWWDDLSPLGLPIDHIPSPIFSAKSSISTNMSDMATSTCSEGFIYKNSTKIQLFSGPSLNLKAGEIGSYLALRYRRTLLANPSFTELLASIDIFLKRCGADGVVLQSISS